MTDRLHVPEGFLWSGVHSGFKSGQTPDLGLAYSSYPCNVAGVFTNNSLPAAPVRDSRQSLKKDHTFRGLIANSGVANAATGDQGIQDHRDMLRMAGRRLGVDAQEVLGASTGKIGPRLPLDAIESGIPEAVDHLSEGPRPFARAIQTTDTTTKVESTSIDTLDASLLGVAKGSGMIRPDMATMLSFIFLDVPVQPSFLNQSITRACARSFNKITVDGDMSTNDTVLVMTARQPDKPILDESHNGAQAFQGALTGVCESLARQIVRDGEGATREVEVLVKGATTPDQADDVAESIAGSNLVKTAIYGQDPNWGRVFSAVGASGVSLDPSALSIHLNDYPVFESGQPVEPDDALEESMDDSTQTITVDLGMGNSSCERWTCDLSEDYITINAGYSN